MTISKKYNGKDGFGEFKFASKDFEKLSKFAYQKFGLNLPDSKRPLVNSRLARRFRELEIKNFDQYWSLLSSDETSAEEKSLLSVLTTNVTHFFRESHHFEVLTNEVLPKLIGDARQGGRVRIWSAGCSSGPEPYSIAMSVFDLCPEAAQLDIKVLGTDIDAEVIRQAREGRYPMRDAKSIPESCFARYSTLERDGDEWFSINESVRSIVKFGVLNLFDEYPFGGSFDVIFCRNVAIYFDDDLQKLLWKKLGGVLNGGGYLFIGHSERLNSELASDFSPAGITVHKKLSA